MAISASTAAAWQEIIDVLSTTGLSGAVTSAGILEALQAQFPSAGWDADTLATALAGMVKRGVVKKQGGDCCNPESAGYILNPKAKCMNAANSVFVSSKFSGCGCPCGATPGTA